MARIILLCYWDSVRS